MSPRGAIPTRASTAGPAYDEPERQRDCGAHQGSTSITAAELTVGAYALQSGVNAFIGRALLHHWNPVVTSRYANRDAGPMRAVSDIIGKRIKGKSGGTASS